MWKLSHIDDSRSKLKNQLRDLPTNEVVPFLLSEVDKLSKNVTNESALNLYTACVSALVNHERYGGLKSSQVQSIADLALNVLNAQRIDPESSRLAFLTGDVYAVLSQIRRKEGLHWEAAWDAELGIRYIGDHPTEGMALRLLIVANRSLRLGNATSALQYLEKSWAETPTAKQKCLIATAETKAHRLSGNIGAATEGIKRFLKEEWLSDDTRRELEWELLCIGFYEDQESSLQAMLKAVKTNSSHHHHSYALESILWCHAAKNAKFPNEAPKVKNLYRRFKIEKDRYGYLYDSAKMLNESYDVDRPIAQRIDSLGRILALAHTSLSVDHELLVWGAAYRWLDRVKSQRLASLCLSRYYAWSLQLSNGKSNDALGILR